MLLNNPDISFPYSYDIDYVRVYQLNESCGSINVNYCSSEPDTSDGQNTLKTVTFGGTSCGGAYFPNINNSLYATDFILIDENTTLGGGNNTLYLDVNNCYP